VVRAAVAARATLQRRPRRRCRGEQPRARHGTPFAGYPRGSTLLPLDDPAG